uniref:tRNA-uridine aminocarboxypropyltransferase 1 n=1 Tax=Homalodisca liturata TaxID=320908 RepID=A0A1B6HMC5_9HEMI
MTTLENGSELPSDVSPLLEIDAFPFRGLKISEEWKRLESIEGRTICPSCKKSRKYFCYSCHIPISEIKHFVPKVKLPIKIDIIKHAREMDGKSTAVHAAVLAPEDVRIFTYPCIPDYSPNEHVVLIFPNENAVSVEEVCKRFSRNVGEPQSKRLCTDISRQLVHRAVFIDSTWNQSRGIFKDPRIRALPSVVLKSRLSQFWRHQVGSPRWYLATIEAIHQFLVELDAAQLVASPIQENEERRVSEEEVTGSGRQEEFEYNYNGQYDNLLFFFRFMYSKIHTLYDHEQLRSYKRPLQ